MKSENFVAAAEGKCQFDRFKKESKDKIDYIEKELANALRQREENGKGVLSDLCMGYVDELRQVSDYDLDDEILRRKIYHGAMLYMFRLLFLFYAEARGLLSDENYSLLKDVEKDARAQHNGDQDRTASYLIWERLAAIFVDIDQTYNGGLFSPQESEFTQFIEETRIADRFLAETLFNLTTYREKNGEERPISYRDMSVRHLGTLYEGLLEHKLFITKEATEVRLTKGKIEFIPASKGGKLMQGRFIPEGAVYFGSDPSERKSTGSYYTPEYIVDYIVRNTVGEKVKELKAAFLKQEKGNLSAHSNAVDDEERSALARLLEQNASTFVREKILKLSVLDPAMGSGHFLVNVTNLISNFITDFLNELGFEGATITGTAYWRRWVVENCIYGVDLNPLAVELAKLSLWILSMAKDQPLSFTSHHLKCGNSLVGAKLDDIGNYPFSSSQKAPDQLHMFERDPNFRSAVEEVLAKSRLIATRSSNSLDDIRQKKTWLDEIQEELKGYKAICNIHTGLYFDIVLDEKQYANLVGNRDFAKAFTLDNSEYFFHWELEFPEIFFGSAGFSNIVGNPPYVRQEFLSGSKYFLQENYSLTYSGTADLYVYFIDRMIPNLEEGGILGLIVSNKWIRAIYAKGLREILVEKTQILRILDFGHSDIFKGTDTFPCILLLSNYPIKYFDKNYAIQFCDVNNPKRGTQTLDQYVAANGYEVPLSNLRTNDWRLDPPDISKTMMRLQNDYPNLGDLIDNRILRGIGTGLNEAFIIHHAQVDQMVRQDPASENVIYKLLRGRNIRRWVPEWSQEWLIVVPSSTNRNWPWSNPSNKKDAERIFKECFPSIYHHLSPYKQQLISRQDKGTCWWEMRSCDYYSEFKSTKILIQGILYNSTFSLDKGGFYLLNSCYFIPNQTEYLLGILNSRLMWWYAFRVLPHMKDEALHPHLNLVTKFPIPQANSDIQAEISKNVIQMISLVKSPSKANMTDILEQERIINQLVYEAYSLSKKEIQTIENSLILRDPIEEMEKRLRLEASR
ncbi:MAG TPA: TaqI-like C-terminal specificity domain-containing protein [Anaerolineales bacterium]|nr:TaqI-like C-terminal specificity domain-containing protein [Anaerolineales bacterium]